MTNSKTALFLRETRCFDDEISHQTREPRAREVFMRANATPHFRSRRRISKLASKYSSHHPRKNHLFCRLGLKTRRLGLYLKRAIGVRNRRRGYPREPKETKIITHSRTLEVIFAEATVEVVKENILYSCRCVCVCVDMISNEVIFDLAAAFVKRAKTREKRGVHHSE